MTYLSDKQKKKNKMIRISSYAAFLILFTFFFIQIQNSTATLLAPVNSSLFLAKENISSSFDRLRIYIQGQKEREEIISALEEENRSLVKENALLRSASNTVALIHNSHEIEIHSLFKSLSFIYNEFLIDKGYADGIAEGDLVYDQDFVPVGTIIKVKGKQSSVSLLSEKGKEYEGFLRKDDIALCIFGNGSGDFVATVPKNIAVEVGDEVSLNDYYEMILGTVVYIQNDDQAVSQVILIKGSYEANKRMRLFVRIQ